MRIKKMMCIFLVYLMCLNSMFFIYANQENELETINILDEKENLNTYNNDDIVSQDGFKFDISTGTIIKYEGSESNLIIPNEIMGVGVDTIASEAFREADHIISIEISEGITKIDSWAFELCRNLTNIKIPESIEYIDLSAFSGCSSITRLTIPKNVRYIESSLGACENLENIIVDSQNKYYCDINGILFNKDKTELVQFPTGKKTDSYSIPIGVKYIGSYSFAYCNNLKNVVIPSSVIDIKYYAFFRMDNLLNVEMSSGLKNIEEVAFGACKSLKNIELPNSITSIGMYAFGGCESLESIHLPNSITYMKIGTFYQCINLKNIKLSDNISYIERYTFRECKSLESINLPDSITYIDEYTFAQCTNLKSIEIPENVTTIGAYSFEECSNLEELKILNKDILIEHNAFIDCNNIKDVYCYKNSQADNKNIFSNSNVNFHYLDDKEEVPKKTAKFIVSDVDGSSDTWAYAGELVDIYINIKENPGIAVYNLKVKFDRTKLTPVSINQGINGGDKITSNLNEPNIKPETLSYITALWTNFSNMNYNGYLFRLKFKIKDNITSAQVPIILECTEEGILDENYKEIIPEIQNGNINIYSYYEFGDINTDEKVNNIDLLMLNQYIAEYNNILFDDTQKSLADVYRDTIINVADLVLFKQYLAGWKVELGKDMQNSLSVFENKSIDLNLKSTHISNDEIKIITSLNNNSGISAFKFKLNYDNLILEPVSIKKGDAIKEGDIISNINSNNKDYITAVWSNTTNINDNGNIFEVTFKIKNTQKNSVDFNLTFNEGDIINQSFEKISANNINKKIYLSKPDESFIYGDVDGDKIITANDASLILQYVLNPSNIEFNEEQKRAAMVSDNNLTVTSQDVTYILNKVLNSDYVFPIVENSL